MKLFELRQYPVKYYTKMLISSVLIKLNKSNSQQLNYFNLGLIGIKQLVKLALQNFVFYSQMEQFKEFVKQRIDVTEEELNDIVSRYQVRKIKKKNTFSGPARCATMKHT
jgi:hypothetical protein